MGKYYRNIKKLYEVYGKRQIDVKGPHQTVQNKSIRLHPYTERIINRDIHLSKTSSLKFSTSQ